MSVFFLLGLSACGGEGASAQHLLDQALRPSKRLRSGRVTLLIARGPRGAFLPSQGVGAAVRITGAFESLGAQRLPRFSLRATFPGAPATRDLGVTATADRLFVSVDGDTYLAPQSLLGELRRSYAQGAAATPPGGALGVAPLRWLTHPARVGTVTLDGVRTVHIRTDLDPRRLGADLQRLQARAGALASLGVAAPGVLGGSTGPTGATGATAAAGDTGPSGAAQVTGGSADVYVGAADHLLRQLSMRTTGQRPVTVVLSLAALNQPQAIRALPRARPLLSLLSALSRAQP